MVEKTSKNIFALLAFLVMCLLVEVISGWWITEDSLLWYEQLRKPFLMLPSFLFTPVWTVIYVLMAFAIWLVWKERADGSLKLFAYTFFFSQLFLNFLWPILFFGQRNIGAGLIAIILLDILVLATVMSFYLINRLSAYLFVPYVGWLIYATYLNFMLWLLNISR